MIIIFGKTITTLDQYHWFLNFVYVIGWVGVKESTNLIKDLNNSS